MDKQIRNKIIVFFLFYFGSMLCVSQEFFMRGNKAYDAGNYQHAIRAYQQIRSKGPAVWYNMANALYKEGDFANAIVCWYRSLPGATASAYSDAQHNISAAYEKLGAPRVSSFYERLLSRGTYRIPIAMAQSIFLFSWLLLCLLFINMARSWQKLLLCSILVVLSLFMLHVVWRQYQLSWQKQAVVVSRSLNLYNGPNDQFDVIGQADIAKIVLIQEKRDNWYKIIAHDAYGWVPADSIEKI